MAFTETTGTATISTTKIGATNGTSTIATNTTDTIVQFFVAFDSIAYGDVFEITLEEKVRSGDSQETAILGQCSIERGALYVSPAVVVLNGWDFGMKKIAGTDRTARWSVRQVT